MRFMIIPALLSLSANAFAYEPENATEQEKEPITKVQFVQQQQSLFNKVDKNFDGRVTMDESKLNFTEKQKEKYKNLFKQRDLDKSGYITFDELLQWHENFTEKRVEEQDRKKESFLFKYDKDGNGTISSYEIDAFFELEKQKHKDRTQAQAQNDFDAKDTDGSGMVSLEEYLDNRVGNSNSAGRRQPDNTIFLKRDENGDYVITRIENEAFITKIFEELDVNGDDELSHKEQEHRAFKISQSMNAKAGYFVLNKEK